VATQPRYDLEDASLEELLRKCHHDELVHLAVVLRVRHQGRGLTDLAHRLSRKLRWIGSHKLMNFWWRRGQPPEYHVVLNGLARRSKAKPVGDTLEDIERAILKKWMRQAWAQLGDEERLRFWSERGLNPPVPGVGENALTLVEQTLGQKARFMLATLTVPTWIALIAVPITPPIGLLFVLLTLGPNYKKLVPAVLEVTRLRQLVLHRVTIGVVGSPSAGKDAAIKAIFSVDYGNVNPVAGSTKKVAITRLPGATATYVVNTPGMGDVVQGVTEEARQVLDHIDVFVYIVNAQGGVQARERADYQACKRSGRPVLAVVNKIDTLRESDRERYLSDARKKLGAPADAFLAAAFDPLPQLSDEPIGLAAVKEWLHTELLGAGKDPSELGWL
jgi:GTP-binding protein EngB required for normal cell division